MPTHSSPLNTNAPQNQTRPTQPTLPVSQAGQPWLQQIVENPLVLYPLCALVILVTAALLFYHPPGEGAEKPQSKHTDQPPTRNGSSGPRTIVEPEHPVSLQSDPPGASVFIDGSPQPGLTDSPGRTDRRWLLRAGKHRVLIVHPDLGVQEKWIEVSPQAGAEPQQVPFTLLPFRPRALVVGVQNYSGMLPAFRHGAGDALDLAHALRAVGYKEADVVLMTQARGSLDPELMPTAAAIRKQLGKLLSDCSTSDVVLLALAGLVIKAPGGGYAFCPDGAAPQNPNTLLPLEDVFQALKKENCRAGAKVVFLDGSPRGPTVDDRNLAPENALDPKKLVPPGGVTLVCGCEAGQQSHSQMDYRRGAFFDAVIHGLWGGDADKNKDRKVTVEELRDYVNGHVPTYVQRLYNKAQNPYWQGPISNTAVLAWPAGQLASLKIAEEALNRQDPEQAEKALKPLLDLTPPPLEALVLDLRRKQQLGSLLLQDCKDALEREPTLPVLHVFRGDAHYFQKRYPEAIAAYDKAVELDNHNAEAFHSRGASYDMKEDDGKILDEKALPDYDRAVQFAIVPTVALYKNRARLHRFRGRYQLALNDVERAMSLKDANKEVCEWSIQQCDNVLKKKNDLHQAWTIRGAAALKLERFQQALDSFNEALKINKNDVPAQEGRTKAQDALKKGKMNPE